MATPLDPVLDAVAVHLDCACASFLRAQAASHDGDQQAAEIALSEASEGLRLALDAATRPDVSLANSPPAPDGPAPPASGA